MTIEERLSNLEFQVANINRSLIQQGRNASATTSKVDDTSNKVVAITPYTAVKTAYYGDKSVTFYDAPQGNVSVFIDGLQMDYSMSRNENGLVVSFEPLEVASVQITISIQ